MIRQMLTWVMLSTVLTSSASCAVKSLQFVPARLLPLGGV